MTAYTSTTTYFCANTYSSTTRYYWRGPSRKEALYSEGMKKARKLFRFLAFRTLAIMPLVVRRPLYRPRRTLSLGYVLRVAFQRKRQEIRRKVKV